MTKGWTLYPEDERVLREEAARRGAGVGSMEPHKLLRDIIACWAANQRRAQRVPDRCFCCVCTAEMEKAQPTAYTKHVLDDYGAREGFEGFTGLTRQARHGNT